MSFDGLKDVLLCEEAIDIVSRGLNIFMKERRRNNIQEMCV